MANQHHSHNDGQLGKLNSNCTSLLCGLATLLKRELFYFTLLDSDSNSNSCFSSRGRERLRQSSGQSLGPFQAQKEGPNGSTDLSSGKTISWWDYQQFIICLQKLKEHCVYEVEGDNQVRDRASSFIKDRNLKAKLYREETLSLTKVLEIVTQYREKEALILVLEGQENNLRTD